MIRRRLSFLTGLALFLTAACNDPGGNLGVSVTTLPEGLNGKWTGVLDGATLVQLSLVEGPGPTGLPGLPELSLNGSGTLTRGSCRRSFTASGFGTGDDYEITLTDLGSGLDELVLFGTLKNQVFSGFFDFPFGAGSTCVAAGPGYVEFGRTSLEDPVQGTLTGSWTGASSATMAVSQTSALVYGAVSWTGNTCAADAFFAGTRSGDKIVGTVTPVFGSFTSYDATLRWDSTKGSLRGRFTVTGSASGSSCTVGEIGAVNLGTFSSAEAAPGGTAVEVTILEVDPEDGETGLLYRYEARGD